MDSVGVATGNRGNPRVPTASTARLMALSPENATVVATARAKVLSVANPAVPTMETQKSSAMTKEPSAATAVEFSTAISGHCPRQRSNHRGNPRQLSCQFPRTSNRSNFHGHPRPSTAIHCHCNPPIRGDYHESPRKSTAISTARATVLSVANSVAPTMPTEVRCNFHGSFCGNCRGMEVRMGWG